MACRLFPGTFQAFLNCSLHCFVEITHRHGDANDGGCDKDEAAEVHSDDDDDDDLSSSNPEERCLRTKGGNFL